MILGIPWWKLFVAIAFLFSFLATSCMDCARYVHIAFLRNSSVSVYIHLCMPGTSINASGVQPCQPTVSGHFPKNCTQVDCPFCPLLVCKRGNVLMDKIWPHFSHDACNFMARPECMLSPSSVHFCTVRSQCTVGISKLIHVHNSAAAEWIGSKLCCFCCTEPLILHCWL